MSKKKQQQAAKVLSLESIGKNGFETLFVNRPAYHQVSAGMLKDTVIRNIESGRLPGFEPYGEAIKRGPDTSLAHLSDAVLWQGAWMEVAEALARRIEGKGDDARAFAVLNQADLWDSRGKFQSVPDAWVCFDFPVYLVVLRDKVRLEGSETTFDAVVARLMRRRY